MSEALRDHLRRTGINVKALNQLQSNANLVETRVGGGNAAGSYMPFGEHFAKYTSRQKNQEMADFVINSIDQHRNLMAKARRPVLYPTHSGVKPVLIHEREMERIGASINPTLYARNPMEKTAFGPHSGKPLGMYRGDLRY